MIKKETLSIVDYGNIIMSLSALPSHLPWHERDRVIKRVSISYRCRDSSHGSHNDLERSSLLCEGGMGSHGGRARGKREVLLTHLSHTYMHGPLECLLTVNGLA